MNTSNVEITAGLGGFLVLFGLALALWLLGRDLSRRLRGIRHREEQERQQRAEAEQRKESDSTEDPDTDDSTTDGRGSVDGK